LGNTPAAQNCPTAANAWCFTSGSCSRRGSGCEAVPGCSEAMRAKDEQDGQAARQQNKDLVQNNCETGLVPGKQNPGQCYCPVDAKEVHATSSFKLCDDVAKKLKEAEAQAQDGNEVEVSLRQCEAAQAHAETCCANPERCMSGLSLNPDLTVQDGGITRSCQQQREKAAENGRSNVTAGGVCTQAHASCQITCTTNAKKHNQAESAKKMQKISQACEQLSQKARTMGDQAMESSVGGYGGQNCKGVAQSSDETEAEERIVRAQQARERGQQDDSPPGATPRERTHPVSYGPTGEILQRPLGSTDPGGEDPYALDAPGETNPFRPVYDSRPVAPVSDSVAAWSASPSGGGPRSVTISTAEVPGAPVAGAAGFSEAGGPAVLNRTYIPYNRGATGPAIAPAQQALRPAAVAGAADGRATASGLRAASVRDPKTGKLVPASLNAKEKDKDGTVKEVDPKGQTGSTGGSGSFGTMSLKGGVARDVASGSLKDYLPGGAKDPHTNMMGAARAHKEIHAKHVNLFEVINERMVEKCELGELLDCG